MALEAVVFPQDLFGCTMKELCSLGGVWGCDFDGVEEEKEKRGAVVSGCGVKVHDQEKEGRMDGAHANYKSSCTSLVHNFGEWDVNSSSPGTGAAAGQRKRRRTKGCNNNEEVEKHRMAHIAIERNRRKQMNEYLSVLRSLMPPPYVQRGDQASIIGGAVNFVKELEQLLHSLQAQKRIKQQSETSDCSSPSSSSPFADFFTFPQYSSCSNLATTNSNPNEATTAENHPAVADIEVNKFETHVNLKVLTRRQPKQFLKMVGGLQDLRLTTRHLNVTTLDQMVLCSFSLKLEEDCHFRSVEEIASAVHQMVGKIQAENPVCM